MGEHRLPKWKNTEGRAALGKEFKLLGPAKASYGHTPSGSLTRSEQKWYRKNNVTTRTGKFLPEPKREARPLCARRQPGGGAGPKPPPQAGSLPSRAGQATQGLCLIQLPSARGAVPAAPASKEKTEPEEQLRKGIYPQPGSKTHV